ncbi:MAG: N-acetyltransferase [Hyphococcus sp.]|nr:MAG: N-acetyltransferase [Marinicaulis sp.]
MSAPSQIEIRNAQLEDADEIADILTEAFSDDPVMNWMFGGARAIATLFQQLTRDVYLRHGFGHLISGSAATLWLYPNAYPKLPLLNEMRIGGSTFLAGGINAINRTRSASRVVLSHHPKEPHYYLFAVGVRKNNQGQGLGGRILREGLKQADANGALAYLENSKPRNTPLYERLGFEPVAPLPFPDGAPPLLAMLRPPSTSMLPTEGAG